MFVATLLSKCAFTKPIGMALFSLSVLAFFFRFRNKCCCYSLRYISTFLHVHLRMLFRARFNPHWHLIFPCKHTKPYSIVCTILQYKHTYPTKTGYVSRPLRLLAFLSEVKSTTYISLFYCHSSTFLSSVRHHNAANKKCKNIDDMGTFLQCKHFSVRPAGPQWNRTGRMKTSGGMSTLVSCQGLRSQSGVPYSIRLHALYRMINAVDQEALPGCL